MTGAQAANPEYTCEQPRQRYGFCWIPYHASRGKCRTTVQARSKNVNSLKQCLLKGSHFRGRQEEDSLFAFKSCRERPVLQWCANFQRVLRLCPAFQGADFES